jgi:hypothetical protein
MSILDIGYHRPFWLLNALMEAKKEVVVRQGRRKPFSLQKRPA